tara:strand:+ start:584 stop:982 length:399 start_codon:yes stop_codon:yes gene_type:complete
MAIIAQSAFYSSGLFGVSRYGQINLSVSLASVTATSAVNTVGLIANATFELASVSSTISLGTINPIVIAKCDGVSATLAINDNLTINTTIGLSSVQSTLTLGAIVKTAEVFNFELVKTQYSRKRCVYIQRAA